MGYLGRGWVGVKDKVMGIMALLQSTLQKIFIEGLCCFDELLVLITFERVF